jgi:uncharacterized protein (TIRG00374 family)
MISGIALWAIAQAVNLQLTAAALAEANLVWFLLAFVVQLLATAFVIVRWQVLLRPYPTHLFNLTQIFFISHLLNTILPVKLGTVARILLAAESEKLNVGFTVGSVAIEKILDTVVMLVLLLALAPFVPLPSWLRDSLVAAVLLVLGILLVIVTLRRVREPLLAWLARLESKVFRRESHRTADLAAGLIESLVNFTQRREALPVLFWTALVWVAGGLVNQLLFSAVGLQMDGSAAWFVMVVLQIGTRVPSLPANLGVFHYLVVLALGVYGVNASAALAYAILLHLVVFILPAIIGAACALPVSARLVALAANGLRRTV